LTTEASQIPEDEEIDIAQLLHTLWLQRIFIAFIAIAGALLGGLAGQFSTKYVSEAVLQTGEFISASNYKRYEPTLLNSANLKTYLERSSQINKEAAELLLSASQSPTGMQELIKPEFALTADSKRVLESAVQPIIQVQCLAFDCRLRTVFPAWAARF